MSLSFTGLLEKCLHRGLVWGWKQICLSSFFLLLVFFLIPFSGFFAAQLFLVVLFSAPGFGVINGVIVTIVYRIFYKRAGMRTLLMAISTAVVIGSSIFFLSMNVTGFIIYNKSSGQVELGFVWYLLYLVTNTIWLSWRLSKFADQLLIESARQAKETPNFQNASYNAIMQRIKKDYLSHTRYQLDAKLLGLGYDPADIEAAWQTFLASYRLPQLPKSSTRLLLTYYSFNLVFLVGVLFWVLATARYQ